LEDGKGIYRRKEIMSRNVGLITGMLASFGASLEDALPRRLRASPELKNIDLEKEYALIKEKKSSLSSNLRDEVVYLVEERKKSYGQSK
jgi:hypothetical protein